MRFAQILRKLRMTHHQTVRFQTDHDRSLSQLALNNRGRVY